jgi:hypothetical protein
MCRCFFDTVGLAHGYEQDKVASVLNKYNIMTKWEEVVGIKLIAACILNNDRSKRQNM